MVDFTKLGTGPREIDYLAYLIDECKLNSWQASAFPSMLQQLRTKVQWLSQKQNKSVMDAVKEFKLDTEHKEFCVRGYADRDDVQVMNNVGPGSRVVSGKDAAANQGEKEELSFHKRRPAAGFDDMDDDIPF